MPVKWFSSGMLAASLCYPPCDGVLRGDGAVGWLAVCLLIACSCDVAWVELRGVTGGLKLRGVCCGDCDMVGGTAAAVQVRSSSPVA